MNDVDKKELRRLILEHVRKRNEAELQSLLNDLKNGQGDRHTRTELDEALAKLP